MKISELMHTDMQTVQETESLTVGMRKLREHRIKHLPVLAADGTLKGIVTDRDLKRASASDATTLEIHELLYLLDKVTMAEVMTKNPVTATPDTSVGAAAALMADRAVGCLPITEGAALKGIVTATDLLKHMAKQEAE